MYICMFFYPNVTPNVLNHVLGSIIFKYPSAEIGKFILNITMNYSDNLLMLVFICLYLYFSSYIYIYISIDGCMKIIMIQVRHL